MPIVISAISDLLVIAGQNGPIISFQRASDNSTLQLRKIDVFDQSSAETASIKKKKNFPIQQMATFYFFPFFF